MKKVLYSLTLLFAAALLMNSCNQPDEDLLPPTNSSQLTAEQAWQMLQGTWYLYKSESVNGPICAGGANETRYVHTYDLQYAGYRLDFTENVGGAVIYMDVPAPTYEMYYDGLSYTCGYNVLSCPLIVDGIDFTPTYNQFFNDITLQDNDLILNFDYAQLEGIVMYGGLIISLTADELVLKPRYSSSYYYFKRTNENVLPRNDVNLDGVFVFDNYKEVESDVLTLDQNINDGSSCTFTSDLSLLDKEIHYKGLFSPPLPGTISDITFPHIGWIENDNTFAFEVSETHLNIFSLSYEVYPYKIVQYNDFELVLRYHMNCNTYKEYHLTKVN